MDTARQEVAQTFSVDEVGVVRSVEAGIASVTGLPGVASDELVQFEGGELGVATDLTRDTVGVTLLTGSEGVRAGTLATRVGRVLDVPVGEELLGRVVTPLGEPLDEGGPVRTSMRLPVERPATPIFERSPVSRPLHTGVKVVDALFPVGRGQRELIIGDRQSGKTSLAVAAILNQRDTGVKCIYCSIGSRGSQVARTVATLAAQGALEYTTVVVAASHAPPGIRQVAPFAATSMAEALMEDGHDVLIVYDDLTQHARSYRELSLLLRRPPGREAYPGDVFYLHARLLERATQLSDRRGGGSLTALPIVEIQEGNLSAYIPTNLISITDGQIVLSPALAARGVLPAVNIGLSVSRVGGKAQLPAFREVSGRLRLAHAQFEELERFARFGADLDEGTRQTLLRGERVREILQQGATETIPASEQIAVLLALNAGLFDGLAIEKIPQAQLELRQTVRREHAETCERIESGEALTDAEREALLAAARQALRPYVTTPVAP